MLGGAAYWHQRTYLLVVALWAFVVLVDFLATFWRSWGKGDTIADLAITFVVFVILMISLFGLRHVWELDKLRGQVEEKTLDRVSQNAFGMGLFGYLALQAALLLLRPH